MLLKADARQIPLRDETVQCVVTSPPYWGLRDYGVEGQLGLEAMPEEYITNLVMVFREVRRVLRKDGTLWLNLGDGYAESWGNYWPQTKDGPSRQRERGSWRRKAYEGRESQSGNLTGTTWSGFKPKDLIGIPWRVAFALQADGWWLRLDIIWAKPNPMPESVKDRPTQSHEYLFLLTKSARYYYDAEAIREPGSLESQARYKRGRSRHHKWADGGPMTKQEQCSLGRNKRSVWWIATQPYSGSHFATFPEKLVEPCILAGSREGDIVLDPFVGSGTTVRVAEKFNRTGIGCDLAYQDIASLRTRNVQRRMAGMFG